MPFFALGIPGALASMDVVHFHWGRCPYSLQNLHIGKEGYPTVACEMACTHDGKFIHSTSAVYGAMNDKAIVRFDEFSELLRDNSVYSDVQFQVRLSNDTDGEGNPIPGLVEMLKRPYVIVDGGYHRWRHLMSVSRNNSTPEYIAFRKQLESIRKDIECAFGVLKGLNCTPTTIWLVPNLYCNDAGRWRILKLPMLFHKQSSVNNVIQTCVILHNMLHDLDCRSEWKCGLQWGGAHGHFDDQGRHWGLPTVDGEQVRPGDDYSRMGRLHFSQHATHIVGPMPRTDAELRRMVELQRETSPGYYELQHKLVTHFKCVQETGDVLWLRS